MEQRLNRSGHLFQLMFWNCRHCGQHNYPKKVAQMRTSFRLELSCSRCGGPYLFAPGSPPQAAGARLAGVFPRAVSPRA
jgi:hypothetical protein